MRILVLGGNGFIGSHVVDCLVEQNLDVRVFDRAPEKFRTPIKDVNYVFGDFGDSKIIVEALKEIDVVMHLVSATVPGTAALDPQADVLGNLLPTIKLMEALSKSRVRKLIYLSSGGTVYGIPESVPVKERHPLRPISSYGIVKVAIEHYLQLYARDFGIATTILRPSNPYGPRQGHTGLQGVVGTFLQRAINDEPILVWGDGSVVRDYLFVSDLADLCSKAVISSVTGIFNAGYGEGITINGVIEQIQIVTGKKLNVTNTSGRTLDVPVSILDITATSEVFGWSPQTDFAKGIQAHWKWLRSVCG